MHGRDRAEQRLANAWEREVGSWRTGRTRLAHSLGKEGLWPLGAELEVVSMQLDAPGREIEEPEMPPDRKALQQRPQREQMAFNTSGCICRACSPGRRRAPRRASWSFLQEGVGCFPRPDAGTSPNMPWRDFSLLGLVWPAVVAQAVVRDIMSLSHKLGAKHIRHRHRRGFRRKRCATDRWTNDVSSSQRRCLGPG